MGERGPDPYKGQQQRGAKGNKSKVFKFPDDVKFTKFDKNDKDHDIAIVPHEIKSDNHTMLMLDGWKKGNETYAFDFWTHNSIGAQKVAVACPAQNWGHKCPICEEYDRLNKELGYQHPDVKALKARHRVIYNIVDLTEDANSTVMSLFETSYSLFEEEVRKMAESKGRREGAGMLRFGDLEEGWAVEFTVNRKKLGTSEFSEFVNVGFHKIAAGALPAELIDDAFDPSEFIDEMTYDELVEILEGQASEEGSGSNRGGRGGRSEGGRGEDRPARGEGRGRGDAAPERSPEPAPEAPRGGRGGRGDPAPAEASPRPERGRAAEAPAREETGRGRGEGSRESTRGEGSTGERPRRGR